MDREKLKLLVRQLELSVDAIKAEIYSDVDSYRNSPAFKQVSFYMSQHQNKFLLL